MQHTYNLIKLIATAIGSKLRQWFSKVYCYNCEQNTWRYRWGSAGTNCPICGYTKQNTD